jgi:hypothetical protein
MVLRMLGVSGEDLSVWKVFLSSGKDSDDLRLLLVRIQIMGQGEMISNLSTRSYHT